VAAYFAAMLVISREANESLTIDWLGRPELGVVTVTVLRQSGRQVRLGLEGPNDARFLRSELLGAPTAAPRSSAGVAEIFTRVARLLVAQMPGRDERDQTILADAAAHLRALAGDQL
jgi:carbon storage regulator CsrA